jgi:hypothetical protein
VCRPIGRGLAIAAIVGTLLLALAGPALASELDFRASIVSRDGNSLVVNTSGNEALRFDLSWFANRDGYALRPNEEYCFVVNQLTDGRLMVVSVETCQEPPVRREDKERPRRDERQEKEDA